MLTFMLVEIKKQRRNGVLVIATLLPSILTILISVDYLFRKSFYLQNARYDWQWYLKSIESPWSLFGLPMFIIIISIYDYMIELKHLKMLMIQPRSRKFALLSKNFLILSLGFLSNCTIFLSSMTLGAILGLGGELNMIDHLINVVIFGTVAMLPTVVFLTALIYIIRNPMLVSVTGIINMFAGAIFFSDDIGRYIPGSYMPRIFTDIQLSGEDLAYIIIGMIFSLIIYLIGQYRFEKKEFS